MGSPLGPTLANDFLYFHKRNWLDECPLNFEPILYRRYFHDCFFFFVFDDSSHVVKFEDFLNRKYKGITYRVEVENNFSLPFLDVLVIMEGNWFSSIGYRKDSFTG